MATYSIRELEDLTGIKAHTIRAWEKRYGIVCPARSCLNIREYSDKDLQVLNHIAFLKRHGYKISRIATLSRSEIADHVTQLRASRVQSKDHIEMLMMALMDFNASKTECIISAQIRHNGVEETMTDLVFPMMSRMGLLLMSGSLTKAQEMLFVDIVRQKLRAAIDDTPRVKANDHGLALLVTAPRLMEIHRLFVQYLCRKSGIYVLSFMDVVSPSDLHRVLDAGSIKDVFTLHDMAVDQEPLVNIINVCASKPGVGLVICGNEIHLEGIDLPGEAVVLHNMSETLDFVFQRSPAEIPD
ncbi:MAG: MerR family transcriptional regulator [Saprospiraceae bacterium]|nr:MerR family transcriptional regulator [Saprospiraceae bacterium]